MVVLAILLYLLHDSVGNILQGNSGTLSISQVCASNPQGNWSVQDHTSHFGEGAYKHTQSRVYALLPLSRAAILPYLKASWQVW